MKHYQWHEVKYPDYIAHEYFTPLYRAQVLRRDSGYWQWIVYNQRSGNPLAAEYECLSKSTAQLGAFEWINKKEGSK